VTARSLLPDPGGAAVRCIGRPLPHLAAGDSHGESQKPLSIAPGWSPGWRSLTSAIAWPMRALWS